MGIIEEINKILKDKRVYDIFKKKMKIEYLLNCLNTNYKITNHFSGNFSNQ